MATGGVDSSAGTSDKIVDKGCYPINNWLNTALSASYNEKVLDKIVGVVVHDLNHYGLCAIDKFLELLCESSALPVQISAEVQSLHQMGRLEAGQVIRGNGDVQQQEDIRGDLIMWLTGEEQGLKGLNKLIRLVDYVITTAMQHPNAGQLLDYHINHRTKAMAACYPGSRSHYIKHVDNPHGDGRVITAIYYLNQHWAKRDGGELVIYSTRPSSRNAIIEPRFDRLVFFWSDGRNPHEVKPALSTRYAVTLWYLDEDERNRYITKMKQLAFNRNVQKKAAQQQQEQQQQQNLLQYQQQQQDQCYQQYQMDQQHQTKQSQMLQQLSLQGNQFQEQQSPLMTRTMHSNSYNNNNNEHLQMQQQEDANSVDEGYVDNYLPPLQSDTQIGQSLQQHDELYHPTQEQILTESNEHNFASSKIQDFLKNQNFVAGSFYSRNQVEENCSDNSLESHLSELMSSSNIGLQSAFSSSSYIEEEFARVALLEDQQHSTTSSCSMFAFPDHDNNRFSAQNHASASLVDVGSAVAGADLKQNIFGFDNFAGGGLITMKNDGGGGGGLSLIDNVAMPNVGQKRRILKAKKSSKDKA
uniref:hypoxia-inducible factor-proline dioxygenase n=1 Tax=Hirondellea gigas TaxID=1518452 RepID=A0A6A7FRT7_9CRUS